MTTLKVPVSTDDHIHGNENAPITLVEYGDFECPYCGMAHPIIKRLQKHFGNQLSFVFRNFPLSEIHPHAEVAAETAEYAGSHRRFWEMHDLLYENQDRLGMPLFLELADALNLPADDLENAIMNKKFESKIRKDFLGGVRSGVNGTPTFYINGQRYNGPIEFEELVFAIDAILVG